MEDDNVLPATYSLAANTANTIRCHIHTLRMKKKAYMAKFSKTRATSAS